MLYFESVSNHACRCTDRAYAFVLSLTRTGNFAASARWPTTWCRCIKSYSTPNVCSSVPDGTCSLAVLLSLAPDHGDRAREVHHLLSHFAYRRLAGLAGARVGQRTRLLVLAVEAAVASRELGPDCPRTRVVPQIGGKAPGGSARSWRARAACRAVQSQVPHLARAPASVTYRPSRLGWAHPRIAIGRYSLSLEANSPVGLALP